MNRLFPVAWLTISVAIALGVVVAESQTDPRIGTWKVNLAKSKYDPGPPPKSDTRVYELRGGGVKVTVEEITANGKRQTATYTAKYDGKDYPYSGNPNIDAIVLKRINSQTVDMTAKKGTKVVGTINIVISADGKTMTQRGKYINARGLVVDNIVVYDKQ